MAIRMTTGGEVQQPQIDLNAIAKNQIGAERSQMLAQMLNEMSVGAERLPGSPLEGISRVFNAGVGAMHSNRAFEAEQAQRQALIQALGGQNIDPIEAAMFASGDKSAVNTILQGRLSDRRLAEQRAYEAKLLADERAREERIRKENRDNALADREKLNDFEIQKVYEKANADAQVAATKPGAKAVNMTDQYAEKVMQTGEQISFLKELQADYKASFSGMGGGLPFGAQVQQFFGTNVPSVASKNTEQAATFWQKYKRFSELVERHGLFGSALTASEQEQWRMADVSPDKSNAANVANFNARMDMLRRKAEKQVALKLSQGIPPEQLTAALGFDINSMDAMFPKFPEVPETPGQSSRATARGAPAPAAGGFKPALKPDAAPAPAPAQAQAAPAQPAANAAIEKARAAIAAGADPEAVKKRLQEAGYDPSGL